MTPAKHLSQRLVAKALVKVRHSLENKTPEKLDRIGENFGRVLYVASAKRRNRALHNLSLAFPEKSLEERHEIARASFIHFGRESADFLASASRTPDKLESELEIVGREHVDQALNAGKGALMITGHLGNWERMSSWLSYNGYPLSVIARDTNDPIMNQMVNDVREGPGTRVISRGNAAKPILQLLKHNELVGILPDQNTAEHFVPFFGWPAGTVLGPGLLHRRTGAPLLPCYCVRLDRGHYRVVFEPVLEAYPDRKVKGEGGMLAINQFLERAIRRYPEQWLWFHDRWKSARRRGLAP